MGGRVSSWSASARACWSTLRKTRGKPIYETSFLRVLGLCSTLRPQKGHRDGPRTPQKGSRGQAGTKRASTEKKSRGTHIYETGARRALGFVAPRGPSEPNVRPKRRRVLAVSGALGSLLEIATMVVL
eukprot:3221627-Pyramimonas_sp.AAC.1